MAWYLENPSSSVTEVHVSSVTIGGAVGDYLEYKGFANAGNRSDLWRLVGQQAVYNNLLEISTNSLTVRFNNVFVTKDHNQAVALGEEFTVRIERTAATEWTYYLNGVAFSSFVESNSFTFDQFMNFSIGSEALRGALYYVECGNSSGATNLWDASASGGTGSTLPDTVGANDGTLVNFPTDDSQWVFYSAGVAGTEQDLLLVSGQQAIQAVAADVNQVAAINAIVASQRTQTQASTVSQVAALSSGQAQQVTEGDALSTEQIADLAAVVVEQFTQAQAVDVSVASPNELVVAVIEQLTQAQATNAVQSAEVAGLAAESVTDAQAVGIASDYSLIAVTGEQLTQAGAVDILDGTGLNVVTLEQSTQAQAATVTLLALFNGVSVETRHESSTVATAATILITANQAQQLTEADIADILGSAMQLNPRELTITRTTTVFNVRLKHSIH